ncbi:MAG: ABC transporter ATP-binding protein [Anaerolineaceae bacterium]|nr:ABC transporter ATP-binding protein [Anaerolineaceae bacterium]
MADKQKYKQSEGAGNRGRGRRIERPKNAGQTLLRILSYLKHYKIRLIIAAACMVTAALATVGGTYFLKPALNNYIVPLIGQENPDLSGFIHTLCIMAAFYVTGALANFTLQRMMITITNGTLRRVRIEMFTHMQDLPLRYFDSRTHGSIMSTYTNDTDALREMIAQSIPQMVNSVITVISVFIMMLILSWQMTIIVILWILLMFLVLRLITGNSSKYFIRQQKELSVTNGFVEEMIEGAKVIKVFNHEDTVKEEFDELSSELFHAASTAHTFANILFPIMGNISYIVYAILAVAGAVLAIHGITDVGTIGAFLQYSRNFSQPITQMSQQINSVLTALAGAERIFRLLDEPAEVDEGKITLVRADIAPDGTISETPERTGHWAWKVPQENGSFSYVELRGDVRFHDVTFAYDEGKTVLHNISLYAKPGQKIAFVGSTGAGKTTITNLINRFYDVQEGVITYDGINVKDIKKDDLRSSLGMVLQDTHLFTGTVEENIRYGRLDATHEDVLQAAKLANADFFIRHLPQGYDTVLTADGANLSQGQRQLLNIARAAVADPPVLILDEATSSIDTRTEALIEQGMDGLMKDRTVFVIAHRLSTVRNSNAIMVLEKGSIIERGDHDSLLEQKGRYYQLYTGMFELS